MVWSSPDSLLSRLLSGDPLAILIAFVVAISLPILVHSYLYRASTRSSATPAFLLLGSSGAGKTSLLSLLQRRSSQTTFADPSQTRTSQIPNTTTLFLPTSVSISSNQYRSQNDDAAKSFTKYQLIDTPGHGKLRSEQALSFLTDPSLRGIVFVVDAAALDSGESAAASVRDAAAYLHNVLLALQRRKTGKGGSKAKTNISVLIAANKQDLFTALPQGAVKERLEVEIERVRTSKSKGLTTVGEDEDEAHEEEVLGGDSEDRFTFKLLNDDFGIDIDVLGGAVKGEEAGKGVRRWEEWIGSCL